MGAKTFPCELTLFAFPTAANGANWVATFAPALLTPALTSPLHFFTVFNITRLVEVLIASTSAINLLGEVELAVVIIIPERQA